MALIDLVRWDPGRDGSRDATGQQLYAWRYQETNLSTMTQLIVQESQEAVLFSKGQLLGKFGPGKHTLNTENLPVLRRLFGLPFGGKNPFTAEVWFVNRLVPLTIDWSTDGMMYQDPDYQTMVPMVAKGRYGLRVEDAERFLLQLVGTSAGFGAADLTNHFWGPLVAKTKSVLLGFMQGQRIGIKSIGIHLDALSEHLKGPMQVFWEAYGFRLTGFYVTSVEIDGESEAGRRILEAMARQSAQAIGGYTWQQSQTFEIAKEAVGSMSQGSGILGAVMATNMMAGGGFGGALLQPTPSPGQAPAGPGGPAPGAPAVREVFCSNCSRRYQNSSKFCPHCGDPYSPCPRCGADNDAKARRCVSCATPMAPAQGAAPSGCGRCGAPLQGNPTFCPQCGKKVEGP